MNYKVLSTRTDDWEITLTNEPCADGIYPVFTTLKEAKEYIIETSKVCAKQIVDEELNLQDEINALTGIMFEQGAGTVKGREKLNFKLNNHEQ